jgi:hypothetical protein
MATASAETLVTMQKGRLAIQNFANVPQSQRRYVQIGWMKDAIKNLDNTIADLDTLVAEEAVTPDQAEQMREVHRLLHHGLDTHDDFLEFDPEKDDEREWLLSNGLENDDWEAIRQAARKLYGDIAGEGSVFIAINAK